jgi:amino acid permease
MIRLIKAVLGIGVIINAINIAGNGVWGATNQATLTNFMYFLVAYIIVDIIKDGMDNLTGGPV